MRIATLLLVCALCTNAALEPTKKLLFRRKVGLKPSLPTITTTNIEKDVSYEEEPIQKIKPKQIINKVSSSPPSEVSNKISPPPPPLPIRKIKKEIVNNNFDDDDFSVESLIDSSSDNDSKFKFRPQRGDKIDAKVTRFGHLGMSVESVSNGLSGMVLQQELAFFRSAGALDPKIGDAVTVFVQRIRDDGKLDLSLRPVGFDKFQAARDMLLKALQQSPTKSLELGDKSSPEDIAKKFPAMSKNLYKAGLSTLLREGFIELFETEMKLIPENQRAPTNAAPYSCKTPRGFKATDSATLFLSNFPYDTTEQELADCIEEKTGFGKLAKIKMCIDRATGRQAGFAYCSFFTPELTQQALEQLRGAQIDGRLLKVAPNMKTSTTLRQEFKSPQSRSPRNEVAPGARAEESMDEEELDQGFDFEDESPSSGKMTRSDARPATRVDVKVNYERVASDKRSDFFRNERETTDERSPKKEYKRSEERTSTRPSYQDSSATSRGGDRQSNDRSYAVSPQQGGYERKDGRKSIVDEYLKRQPSPDKPLTYSVFVGGLPFTVTEALVKQSLEAAFPNGKGSVCDVRLTRFPDTQKPKGYGYVDFINEDMARQAVTQLNGRMLLGRPVKMDLEGPKHRAKNY